MGVYRTEVLVIKAVDYGEAGKILVLLTRKYGKIHAIAKGVRRPKSRLRGGIQLFTYADCLLYQGKSLDTVTQTETKETFPPLRHDLLRFAYASYIAEVLDKTLPMADPQEDIFLLTVASYYLLCYGQPELTVRAFELKLLDLLGYRPCLTGCVSCYTEHERELSLSFAHGGLLCPRCCQFDPAAIKLSPEVLSVMRFLLNTPIDRVSRLRVSPSVLRQLEEVIPEYIEKRIEKKLHSLNFIKDIKQSQA